MVITAEQYKLPAWLVKPIMNSLYSILKKVDFDTWDIYLKIKKNKYLSIKHESK